MFEIDPSNPSGAEMQLVKVNPHSTDGEDEEGLTSMAPASGPYYRLITLSNQDSLALAQLSDNSSSEMSGDGENETEAMASPAAGVMATSQDELAPPPFKVKKLSQEEVKEAEVTAATALLLLKASSFHPQDLEGILMVRSNPDDPKSPSDHLEQRFSSGMAPSPSESEGSEEEVNLQQLKLQQESSPPRRGEAFSPRPIKIVSSH